MKFVFENDLPHQRAAIDAVLGVFGEPLSFLPPPAVADVTDFAPPCPRPPSK